MKKKILALLAAMILCLSLAACGGGNSSSSEHIVGSWTAIGVIYDGEYTSFDGTDEVSQALADLYDTQYVTYDANGTYQMQNGAFTEEGTWEKQSNEEDLSYTYMMTADDGDQKLAGVMDDNTDVMMIYDMSLEEDQIMLVYGRDGADADHVYFDYGDYVSDDSVSSDDSGDTYISYDSAESYSSYDSATSGERNALEKAWDYLDCMAFSYDGLIDQLEFEGFSYTEAKYAVDNCGADWYEQAAKKAQEYLDAMSFSRSGLIEQLEFEGFTYEQASYGVDAVY